MARFRYQHIKSSVEGKAPTAAQLKVAEIGVNDFAGDEKLFIKNSTGDVVDFPRGYSREYIDDNERVIAEALNDLNSRKLDSSAYTEIWESGTGKSSAVLKGSSGTASGDYSVAEGYQTSGTGVFSHAEGVSTNASGQSSHAEGTYTTASGNYSHAEGSGTIASGSSSHAEGSSTIASGSSSHAEGQSTLASGHFSHAEGNSTSATSTYTHAEGYGTQAIGNYSHAEGNSTIASGNSSHTEGNWTKASGDSSHAEGNYTTASGRYSHAEGNYTTASGDSSHAEGNYTKASGYYSHAEGSSTTASGSSSHAEGYSTTANGSMSHAEGAGTVASGNESHAEGQNTTASGLSSHAEGASTHANGDFSHAEGAGTNANGNFSHTEGNQTTASGICSHAEGASTNANGNQSHTEGIFTTANNQAEHASGQYNISSSASTTFGDSGNTLFSVGNGTASDARHNAFEIRQNGDIYIINKDGDDVRLQDEIGNIDVDQVIDETTSASTNPVSTSAVYSAITENEFVWANAYVVISGAISSHTENTEIHVTAADKEKLHTHSNKAALDSITGNVGTMAYEDKASYSSATEVNTALGGKANTASTLAGYGITNAYTKSETSGATELQTAFNAIDDLVGSGFTSSSITDVIIENERIVSEALNDLDGRKLDASAYTPTDLTNYYTKSQTSGATELSTEFAKYYTTAQTSGATEISTALSAKASKTEDLDGVKLKKITQSAYDALVQAGTVDPNTLYIITD